MTHVSRFTVDGQLSPAMVALAKSARDAYIASNHAAVLPHDDVLFNAAIVALQGFLATLDPNASGTSVRTSVETGCSDDLHLTPYVAMSISWRQAAASTVHHWRTTMIGNSVAERTLANSQMSSVIASQNRTVEAGDSAVLDAQYAAVASWSAAVVPATPMTCQMDVTVSDGALTLVNASLSISTAQPAPAPPDPLAGVLTPPGLVGAANNYNPTGLAGTVHLRLTAASAASLTGLAGGTGTREIRIYNIGTQNITLTASSTLSLAANRFLFNGSVVLKANQGAALAYDPVALGWRMIGLGA